MLSKNIFMLMLGLLCSVVSSAQVFNAPITYLGIDFTRAKVFGEMADAAAIVNAFTAINNVVINEPNKYDIAGAIRQTNVPNDLSFVNARNRKTDAGKIKSDNVSDFTHLTSFDIDKLVKEYNFNGKKGTGLLFVVDGMSKLQQAASVYVTFIDMDTKRVLLTERLEGKAGGFGLRNYWAKPFEEILKQIEKSKYKSWKGRN